MRAALTLRLVLSIAVLSLPAGAPMFAQTETATLSGIIQDPKGAVVPDVEVTTTRIETSTVATTKTNGAGIYFFTGLMPGHYHLVIRKLGFKEIAIKDFQLYVQDKLEQNFSLEIGSVSETVTVNAGAPQINTTDAAVSTVIDRQFVANMPLNGRSFQDLLTLVPGAALVGNGGNGPGVGGEISVNGQRTEANYFTVDGVSTNVGTAPGSFGFGAGYAGATPGETVLGTTQTMISVDALQEFRATTSTYSAEYGRTPGGQFSFTTRSGTNDWHGSAYDYFRNEVFDANNWFNNLYAGLYPQNASVYRREKERQNDFGGTLGGPVIIPHLYSGKDKTFFFFSYEGLRLWTPQGVQTSAVPDATLRTTAPTALQPLLNAFPLPNAGEDGLNDGFGFYSVGVSNPSSVDSISLRIDHSFNDKFKVFGRYANTPTVASNYQTAFKGHSNIDDRLVTVGATAMITSRQANELRFNITQNNAISGQSSTNLGGATPLVLGGIPGPNGSFPSLGGNLSWCFCFGHNASGGVFEAKASQRQYNVTDAHSWGVGRHNLKVGVDWRRLSTYAIPALIGEFAYFYSQQSLLANTMDSSGAYTASASPGEPVYTNFSVFGEDDWKVARRLSLSLGLRWDVNPAPGNLNGPPPYTVDQITDLGTVRLAPAGTPLWQTDWRGFAPRLGAAYQVRQTPGRETVVRGGFGSFYDMGNSQGSTGLSGVGFGSSVQFASASFPLTSQQLTLPAPSVAPPYNNAVFAFDPHLKLPYTLQWSLAIEQALGHNNALTASYVGSAGRRLLTTFGYNPVAAGNANFSAEVCGTCLYITRNLATSDYNALQLQFQQRLSHGLQAQAAYTWSHSLDDASSNFSLQDLLRSSSSFDIRHNFQAAVIYDVPGRYKNSILSALLEHWGLDARISARSALPVDLIGTFAVDPVTHTSLAYHPNVAPGRPLYLYGSQYPGGKIINYDAFQAAPDGVEGDSGRNSVRGFGAWQTNLALRRDFPLHERLRLQFRAEAFNLFNHPNFSGVISGLGNGPYDPASAYGFGVATGTLNQTLGGLNALYQVGGPRSLQLALKLIF